MILIARKFSNTGHRCCWMELDTWGVWMFEISNKKINKSKKQKICNFWKIKFADYAFCVNAIMQHCNLNRHLPIEFVKSCKTYSFDLLKNALGWLFLDSQLPMQAVPLITERAWRHDVGNVRSLNVCKCVLVLVERVHCRKELCEPIFLLFRGLRVWTRTCENDSTRCSGICKGFPRWRNIRCCFQNGCSSHWKSEIIITSSACVETDHQRKPI